jgi:hypothetical protein
VLSAGSVKRHRFPDERITSQWLGGNVAIDALPSILPGWRDRGAIWAVVSDVKQLQEDISAMVGLNLKPDVENEVK